MKAYKCKKKVIHNQIMDFIHFLGTCGKLLYRWKLSRLKGFALCCARCEARGARFRTAEAQTAQRVTRNPEPLSAGGLLFLVLLYFFNQNRYEFPAIVDDTDIDLLKNR